MKKILHISKYYYPYAGGIEDVCYNIVHLLQRKSDYVQHVLCFNDNSTTTEDVYEDIPVTRVAIAQIIASQPISFCYKKVLHQIMDNFQPEIVHFHAPNLLVAYYLLLLLPANVKLIVHWHSDIVAQKIIYQFIKPIESNLLKRADIILTTSPEYSRFSKPLQGFLDKIEIIQNVIDPKKFELTKQRKQQIENIKIRYNNKPIVLFVGRHVPYKGLQYLIQATSYILQNCIFIIGGKGPMTNKLKKKAGNMKNIYFVGRIPDDELASYFYAADVFAFPSVSKNEAFGVVLAEAMYCKTPPVTFTIKGSGVNWVNVNEETGFEVENSNFKALACAINKLLEDSDMRCKMAEKSKQRVDELFLVEKIDKKIEALYQ